MDDHKDNFGATSVSCFYPRNGEDYISYYHSNRKYYEEMVREIHRVIPVGKSKPAIYLSFQANEVLKEVNTPNERASIRNEGYPHMGMWYQFNVLDATELLEVSTIILELSSLFKRDEGGKISLLDE